MRGVKAAALATLFLAHSTAFAIGINVATSGSWVLEIDETDLESGAGSDLTDTYLSASNQVTLEIDVPPTNSGWSVSITRNDLRWDPDLTLYARRTTNGSGSGSINGGTDYQEIKSFEEAFFTGSGDRSNIQVEFRLEGVSVTTLTADNYRTMITYTITD